MSTPPAPATPAPPPAGAPWTPPPVATAPSAPDPGVRSLLSTARTLALLFALLAGLLFVILLAFSFVVLVFGRGPGDLVGAVYCLVSAAVNYLIWRELPRLQRLEESGSYGPLREQLLIWGILGLVFFVVVGLVLLLAWVKLEARADPGKS